MPRKKLRVSEAEAKDDVIAGQIEAALDDAAPVPIASEWVRPYRRMEAQYKVLRAIYYAVRAGQNSPNTGLFTAYNELADNLVEEAEELWS